MTARPGIKPGLAFYLGSLSCEPRGNLSVYTGINYGGFIAHNKEYCAFREVIFLYIPFAAPLVSLYSRPGHLSIGIFLLDV